MENGFNIFLDMDGVLVNWEQGYKNSILKKTPEYLEKYGIEKEKLLNMSPRDFEDKILMTYYLKKFFMNYKKAKSAAKGAFWKPIQNDKEFWTELEWMPDGKDLFNHITNLRNGKKISKMSILSSPSSDKVCEEGKKEWLKKHNIYDTFDSIIIENDKSKYADSNKNNILIDDTPKKVDGFKSSGGTAILHKNTVNTIKELSNLIK